MRKFMINVNGNSYEVEVEEITEGIETAQPSKPAPRVQPSQEEKSTPVARKREEKKEVTVSKGQEVIEAPMPGNIWKILTKEGEEVKAGDVLLILEAMKMENEILAPRDGVVVGINTTEGSAVNTGDKLVVLD